MAFTGGCLCGAVRYRAEAAPFRVTHCHCGYCRKISGAAFLTSVAFKTEDFVWSGDAPSRYRSSEAAERAFCKKCGSTIGVFEDALPHWTQVTLGSLDRPQDVSPEDHIWTDSQIPWIKLIDALPRYPRYSPKGGIERAYWIIKFFLLSSRSRLSPGLFHDVRDNGTQHIRPPPCFYNSL